MNLALLQDLFQRGVVDGDGAVLHDILDSPRADRQVLFNVYRDGYALRLIEALQHDHEALHGYLGDEQFDAMARAYIEACPSQSPNLRWLARRLPKFLSSSDPYRAHRELAELAAIDNALNDAFDAADAPVVSIADMAAVPPDEWRTIRFTPHPSVACLSLSTNAAAIWNALKNDEPPPQGAPLDRPAALLVWRDDTIARFRKIAEPELMMWTEAGNGVTFGVLCEMLATYDDRNDPAARAAGFLHGWMTSGMLSAVQP